MKTDLATAIVASVLGLVVAFLICNTILPEIEQVAFKRLNSKDSDYSVVDPDPDVFNYRALNPTVEVYVGDCTEYDSYGNCVSKTEEPDEEDEEEGKTEDKTNDNTDDNSSETEKPQLPDVEPAQENQNGSTN